MVRDNARPAPFIILRRYIDHRHVRVRHKVLCRHVARRGISAHGTRSVDIIEITHAVQSISVSTKSPAWNGLSRSTHDGDSVDSAQHILDASTLAMNKCGSAAEPAC